jgi:hypothetical protein
MLALTRSMDRESQTGVDVMLAVVRLRRLCRERGRIRPRGRYGRKRVPLGGYAAISSGRSLGPVGVWGDETAAGDLASTCLRRGWGAS